MKLNVIVRSIVITSALALAILVAGCNTMRGVGQDVEAAGDAIEKKANQKKTY